jgi:hypothetical protein
MRSSALHAGWGLFCAAGLRQIFIGTFQTGVVLGMYSLARLNCARRANRPSQNGQERLSLSCPLARERADRRARRGLVALAVPMPRPGAGRSLGPRIRPRQSSYPQLRNFLNRQSLPQRTCRCPTAAMRERQAIPISCATTVRKVSGNQALNPLTLPTVRRSGCRPREGRAV